MPTQEPTFLIAAVQHAWGFVKDIPTPPNSTWERDRTRILDNLETAILTLQLKYPAACAEDLDEMERSIEQELSGGEIADASRETEP